jgi:hypothetical protein
MDRAASRIEDEIRADLFGEMTDAQKAKKILNANARMAAAQIVDLAQNSTNERIRLTASQEILNRVVGPVGKEDTNSALDEFVQAMTAMSQGN